MFCHWFSNIKKIILQIEHCLDKFLKQHIGIYLLQQKMRAFSDDIIIILTAKISQKISHELFSNPS